MVLQRGPSLVAPSIVSRRIPLKSQRHKALKATRCRWVACQVPFTEESFPEAIRSLSPPADSMGFPRGDPRAAFAGDHRVRWLLPNPGIGLVTAATVVAEVSRDRPLPSPERLCSWAGLTLGSAPAMPTTAAATPAKQAPAGCAGCWSRPPPAPCAIPSWAASPARSPSAAVPRSLGWRWPAVAHPVLGRHA
jgi:Transposase IS116/IS110/IS902 family